MQNDLRGKIMYLEGFQVILNVFTSTSYVFEHSKSNYMQIKNDKKKKEKKMACVRKNLFLPYGRGGIKGYGHVINY